MRALLAGLAYPARALGLIRRSPELWGLIVAPILINLAVGAALYASLLTAGLRWIDAALADLPPWAAGAEWLVGALLAAALLVAIGYLTVRFGVVLGAPFSGRLSEKIELRLGAAAPPAGPAGALGAASDIGRALLYELKKLALTLALTLPLLLIALIPVAGQAAALAGQVALGALVACLDFLDAPLERRRLRFRDKLGAVRRGLPATAGFGLVCALLSSIPVLNLLSIPLCVAAGTLLFCERMPPQGNL